MEPSQETEIEQLLNDVREALSIETRALNAAAIGRIALDAERLRVATLCSNADAASRTVSDLNARIREIEAGMPTRPSVLRLLAAWSDDERTMCRTILERLSPREMVGMDLSGWAKNDGGAS